MTFAYDWSTSNLWETYEISYRYSNLLQGSKDEALPTEDDMSFIDNENALKSEEDKESLEKGDSDGDLECKTVNSDKNSVESDASKQNGRLNSIETVADNQSSDKLVVPERTTEQAKKRRKIIPDDD